MKSTNNKYILYICLSTLLFIIYEVLFPTRSASSSDRVFYFLSHSKLSINNLDDSVNMAGDSNSWIDIIELSDINSLSLGKGVVIAIIDSGVDINNPIFNTALYKGWNFGDNSDSIMDKNGHGSSVAGIVLKCVPDAKLMILKVNSGSSKTFHTESVVNAIYYAVENGADVINMSLSIANESTALKNAINYAIDRKIIVVSAAGNNPSAISFPGSMEELITVGAATPNAILWNSPVGLAIDITAPGKYVETIGLAGETVFVTGTSFSTPMVSGAIAALIGMNPYLKPLTIESLLFQTARDVGENGKDEQFGWGVMSGSGIKKLSSPSINLNKTTTGKFNVSCYLPPTDIYADIYIVLVKNRDVSDAIEIDKEYIWWLDSYGIWRGHKDGGALSIASLYIDSKGIDVLLFSDSGGVWKSFSPSEFEHGSYMCGVALIKDSRLLAPIFWSKAISF